MTRQVYAEFEPSAAAKALAGFADVTVLVDSQGFILSATFPPNSTIQALIELGEGRDFRDTLTRESLGKAQELLEDAPREALSRPRELNHRLGDGSVGIRYQSIAQGDNGDILLVGRDLSPIADLQQRLVQAQQATERDYGRIRAMETRYRVLFQLSGEAMLICDAATRKISDANAACIAAFNLPLQRMVGRTLASMFDEHDGEVLAALIANAMSGGEQKTAMLRAASGDARFSITVNLFRQDGASHLLVRSMPTQGTGPLAANDVSFLHGLMERMPEAFVVTDNEGCVVEANRRFLDLTEVPALQGALGQKLDQWLGRPGIDFGVLLSSLRDSGGVRGFSTTLRGAYGSSETVEVSGVALFDHAQPRLGFLIRTEPVLPIVEGEGQRNIPRSVEQMKQLVGNVPMKELVRETTDMIERLCIEAALEMTGDNRASAADMLGLSRQSLYAKLHRFGIGDLSDEPSASS